MRETTRMFALFSSLLFSPLTIVIDVLFALVSFAVVLLLVALLLCLLFAVLLSSGYQLCLMSIANAIYLHPS
jgi:hypothetical protein